MKLDASQILGSVILNSDVLRQYPNVVSVGIGYKERAGRLSAKPCVKIHVRKKLSRERLTHVIPMRWPILVPVGRGMYRKTSVPTDVVKVARVRHAAAIGAGLEIGRPGWDPGTVCCIVKSGATRAALSAAHVFARSGDDAGNATRVYQPDDPSDASNYFGNVAALYYGNEPTLGFVDAAIVEKRARGRRFTLDTGVPEHPRFSGVADEEEWVGRVGKIGAVTGYTEAIFSMRHPQLPIGSGEAIHMLEYKSTSDDAFARPGDSGSPVFTVGTARTTVVGMLVAIGDSGRRGFVVPLPRILKYFDCALVTDAD